MSVTEQDPTKSPPGKLFSVKEKAAWMVQNGWKLISDESQLIREISPLPSVLKTLPPSYTQLDVLKLYLPATLWDLLNRIINRNLSERKIATAEIGLVRCLNC